MANIEHCSDLDGDRALGRYWERQFCVMAAEYGFAFTPQQLGREQSAQAYSNGNGKWNLYTLPDVTIWTAPGQHHEVKHKNPTRHGQYGLEAYRFEALLWFARETQQDVYYTIHNHDFSGGRNNTLNDIAHWVSADILCLEGRYSGQRYADSWVNGIKKRVPILYWDQELWYPLVEIFLLHEGCPF